MYDSQRQQQHQPQYEQFQGQNTRWKMPSLTGNTYTCQSWEGMSSTKHTDSMVTSPWYSGSLNQPMWTPLGYGLTRASDLRHLLKEVKTPIFLILMLFKF